MRTMIPRLVAVGAFALGVLAPGAGVAQAAAPPLPSATTEGALEVTFDSATLNGTVVPGGAGEGSDTRWCFQYGTGSGGGYNLGSLPLLPGDAGQGSSPVPVTLHLTRLQPGSTYRYRLVAVDGLGMGMGSTACGTEGGQEADGAEALFTTSPSYPAPLAVTGAASGVSQNGATISGTVNPQGFRATYEFQLGVDTSYGAQIFGEASGGSEPRELTLGLAHLQPETTYHYRLLAIGVGGTSYGADGTFATTGFPSAVLSAPGAPPLIATPVFAFPAETGSGPGTNTVGSGKKKQKSHKKKTHGKKARKAGRSGHRHAGTRRNG
jgi:hypothetical protein